jgi:hypothetical protein
VRYHNAGDNVAAIDEGVVQDHGDTMLALARHFGDLDLTAARTTEDDLVFFTAPGLGLVAYPVWLGRLLAATATAALVVVAAGRRKRLSGAHLAWATLIIAAMVFMLTTLTWAAWQALLDMNPESVRTLPQSSSWRPATGYRGGSPRSSWPPGRWSGGCWRRCCSPSESHSSASSPCGHWSVASPP